MKTDVLPRQARDKRRGKLNIGGRVHADTCDYVDGDGGAYPTVRAATNQLGSFEDIIHVGMAQPIGAAVGLLYSETADIYYDSAGTYGAGLRSLCESLQTSNLTSDFRRSQAGST